MRLHQRGDARALGRREARERLVEQQDARRGREREPHVEQALAAIGERGGLGALDAGEAEIADERRGLGVDVGDAIGRASTRRSAWRWRACTARRTFSSHREAAEQVGDLERAADAGARDVLRAAGRRSSGPRA